MSEDQNKKSSMDAVIEAYKKDVDMTLIRENLKLTVEERLIKLQNFVEFLDEMRKAGRTMRRRDGGRVGE
jgi:hypothetical protein